MSAEDFIRTGSKVGAHPGSESEWGPRLHYQIIGIGKSYDYNWPDYKKVSRDSAMSKVLI
jgi:hypothetical protein